MKYALPAPSLLIIALCALTFPCSHCHAADNAYLVGSDNTMHKIRGEDGLKGRWNQPLIIEAARNEYEGGQLVIQAAADAGSLQDVSVNVSDMANDKNHARIARDQFTLSMVEYIEVKDLWHPKESRGLWPDPLLPLQPFNVPAGAIQPIWITVYVAPNTPPGNYEGTITVVPKNASQRSLPIRLTVWPFTLPAENHLHTLFYYWHHKESPLVIRQNIEFLAKYRIDDATAGWPDFKNDPDFAQADARLEACFNHLGMAATTMADMRAGPYSPEVKDRIQRETTAWARHLEEKGWLDRMPFKLEDEPAANRLELVKLQGQMIHAINPRIRTLCTVTHGPSGLNDPLMDSIDIWMPTTEFYKPALAEQLRAKGKDVWWYICGGPAHPYPNYFMFYPGIDCRILFWMNWKYHVKGFLYWAVNAWGDPSYAVNVQGKNGKHWPDIPWDTVESRSGDGHLVYPGPDGRFLSSFRLENIRDSVEDYEYLWLLDQLVQRLEKKDKHGFASLFASSKEVLAIDPEVVGGTSQYTLDPNRLLAARRTLAAKIVQVQEAVNSGQN
ncbi:MAG: DUF4091 domain-containing protein [Candidatus Omnitrophica bacterium]|nr:DUF4091 domain-containing protein [Candidatus Omnitrophota bacterium]